MRAVVVVTTLLTATGCGHSRGTLDAARALAEEAHKPLAPVSAADRSEYLRRARIFDEVTAPRDLMAGPADARAFAFVFGERVSCHFIEPRRDRVPIGGTTKKFFCALKRERGRADVKVKYGSDNPETVGEVLGSRLLWALGMATDRNYPVRVRCHDCPAEPWLAYRDYPKPDLTERKTRMIEDAVIQRLFPGVPIEECLRADGGRCVAARDEQGWTFAELDIVDASVGGASRAEVDALRLLAAFIAHGDDKAANQRLVCPFGAIDAAGHCTAPRLLVADLGSTFGRGASRVFGIIDRDARPHFASWSSLPMWEDAASCRVHWLTRASPANPTIGEAGRALLAARLAVLGDRQLRDLFTVARVESLGESYAFDGGKPRAVTVDDWVAAFKRRRAALTDARCPR
ncbi:MAG: hypothetical protein JWN44_1499 [Myxococcales bacterium]|nr:hypothetical protein [Myxococcales bacterium]